MPWSGTAGAQTFTRVMGVSAYDGATCWGQTDAAGRGIRSDDHDYHDQDIAEGISACINRTGGNTVQANIPMGGFKLTGLAAGAAAGDSVRFEQLESGVMTQRGDMLFRNATVPARLAKGVLGSVLMMGTNDPAWTTTAFTGTIGHKVPYLDTINTWSKGQIITVPNASVIPLTLEVNHYQSTPLYTEHNEVPSGGIYNYHTQHAQYVGVPGLGGDLQVVGAIMSTVGAGASNFFGGSDRRMKEDIRDLDDAGSIIDRIKPRHFKWKGTEVHDAGFIADELQEVLPDAVDGEKGGMERGKIRVQMVAPTKLIPFLVAEVKSLRKRVAELEAHAAA